MTAILSIDHPRFPEFLDRLSGREGIDLVDDGRAGTWSCDATTTKAQAIMRAMGLRGDAIASSLAYFSARGGFCDCEIVLEVAITAGDKVALDAAELLD
ncbi:DUF2695 domain-containing protein [Candidatus Solirubrobacter pratensis]|uniref:DUF2695 domain-containing protein n=1 Tax=Candidatus Solirubrobacter pratensis TaxID=1298857 RepID=UPI000412AF80|nr:DUF2695 domain-containing protein [Candidatus Solirubrobacter pratensis]